jgi:hypothetical protein
MPLSAPVRYLLYFLFQIVKLFGVKKLRERNAQAIAEFFNGNDTGIFTSAQDNIAYRGLTDGRPGAEIIHGDMPLSAKL